MNTTFEETQDLYKMIKENRMAMYSSPKRYYNRDGQNGSTFKFLFLIEAIAFLMMILSASSGFAQQNNPNQILLAEAQPLIRESFPIILRCIIPERFS